MVDPVVSSRFGKRPLMDIPAMQVSSTSHQPVSSLQHPYPSPIHEPYDVGSHSVAPRPYHTAPPPGPDPYFYEGHPPREYTHYHGPRGEMVRPVPHYFHPPSKFPGVHIPYVQHAPPQPPIHYAPPPPIHHAPPPPIHHAPPQPPIHHAPPPHISGPYYRHRVPANYGPRPQTFDVTCQLDYGRVAHISVRESHGHFRGIPDYLRQELMRTYAKYPFMEVKIRYENGDYHIYANHDKPNRERDYNGRARGQYYEEENDYDDDRGDRRREDDEETLTDGIQPRPMDAPRGILRERGWNNFR